MILPTPLSGFILQSLCYRRFISHTPRVYHGLVGIGTIQNGEVQYSGNGISNLLNGETYGWVLLDSSTLNAPIITGWCWLEPWNFEWLSRNSWEWKNHPNWLSLTHIFQRGWRKTTNQMMYNPIPLEQLEQGKPKWGRVRHAFRIFSTWIGGFCHSISRLDPPKR